MNQKEYMGECKVQSTPERRHTPLEIETERCVGLPPVQNKLCKNAVEVKYTFVLPALLWSCFPLFQAMEAGHNNTFQ